MEHLEQQEINSTLVQLVFSIDPSWNNKPTRQWCASFEFSQRLFPKQVSGTRTFQVVQQTNNDYRLDEKKIMKHCIDFLKTQFQFLELFCFWRAVSFCFWLKTMTTQKRKSFCVDAKERFCQRYIFPDFSVIVFLVFLISEMTRVSCRRKCIDSQNLIAQNPISQFSRKWHEYDYKSVLINVHNHI